MTTDRDALMKRLRDLAAKIAAADINGFGNECSDIADQLEAMGLLTAPAEAPVAGHIPEGWKLVPVEPTREMLDSYVAQAGRFNSARSDWAAMLAAAPLSAQDSRQQDARSVREAVIEECAQEAERVRGYSFSKRRIDLCREVAEAIRSLTAHPAEPAGKGSA